MDLALDIVGWICMLIGSAFAIVGGVGLLRFPDFFTRLHAGGITDTMGAGMILIGLMFCSGFTLTTFKLATILFFLLITSPTSAHALSKSALTHGLEPLVYDEPTEEDTPST